MIGCRQSREYLTHICGVNCGMSRDLAWRLAGTSTQSMATASSSTSTAAAATETTSTATTTASRSASKVPRACPVSTVCIKDAVRLGARTQWA